jgi:hypothetical protein
LSRKRYKNLGKFRKVIYEEAIQEQMGCFKERLYRLDGVATCNWPRLGSGDKNYGRR